MARCKVCGAFSQYISRRPGVCLECIRERPGEALPVALEAHVKSRAAFGLPGVPPRNPAGAPCNICVNECRIPEGGAGYCGMRKNTGGRLTGVTPSEGKLSWYHDSLPTNCVGDWVCPGGTGAGYPEYAYCPGPEYGYKNLAVFFQACSFNCLYCQNWHFRQEGLTAPTTHVDKLVSDVDGKTSCICYFGGDPTPQLPFSLRASRLAREENRDRILRICWETNGSMNRELLRGMLDIALASGGSVKFDLKAWDENLHVVLTGVTNRRTIENFKTAGERIRERPVPPPLIASTLLVPGYMDAHEVRSIARFIASIDPAIPYSLLAFHPHFEMSDLPMTSRTHAGECLNAAREEGLGDVRVGNVHLLI
jgi:pyruvate formate lyase activating enzyme